MEKRPLSNPTTPTKKRKKSKGKKSKDPNESPVDIPSTSTSAAIPSASGSSTCQPQASDCPTSRQQQSHGGGSQSATGTIPKRKKTSTASRSGSYQSQGSDRQQQTRGGGSQSATGTKPKTKKTSEEDSTSNPLERCKCLKCKSKGCKSITGRYHLMDMSFTIPGRRSTLNTESTREYFEYLHQVWIVMRNETMEDAFELAIKQKFKRFAIAILPENYIPLQVVIQPDPYPVEVQVFEYNTPDRKSAQSKKSGTTKKKTRTNKKPAMYFSFWLPRVFDPRFDPDEFEREDDAKVIQGMSTLIAEFVKAFHPEGPSIQFGPDKPDGWDKMLDAVMAPYPTFDPTLAPRHVQRALRENLGESGILKWTIQVIRFPYPGYTCYIRVPFAMEEYEGTSRKKSVALQIASDKVLKDVTELQAQGIVPTPGSSDEDSFSSVSFDSRSTEGSPALDTDNEGISQSADSATDEPLIDSTFEELAKGRELALLREVRESVIRKDRGQMFRSEESRANIGIPEKTSTEEKRWQARATAQQHKDTPDRMKDELAGLRRRLDLWYMGKKQEKAAAAAAAAASSSDSKDVPSTSAGSSGKKKGKKKEQIPEECRPYRPSPYRRITQTTRLAAIDYMKRTLDLKWSHKMRIERTETAKAAEARCRSDSRNIPSTSAGTSRNTDRASARNAEQMDTQNVEEEPTKKKKKNKKKKSKLVTSEEAGTTRNSEDGIDLKNDQLTTDILSEPASIQRQVSNTSESASSLPYDILEQTEDDLHEIAHEINIRLLSHQISHQILIEEDESKDISDEDVLMCPEDGRSVNERTKVIEEDESKGIPDEDVLMSSEDERSVNEGTNELQSTEIKEDISKEKSDDTAGNAKSTHIDNEEVKEITRDEHPRSINVSPTQIPKETSTSSHSHDDSTQISAMGHAMARLDIGSVCADETLGRASEEETSKPAPSEDSLADSVTYCAESNKPINQNTTPATTEPDQDIAAILSEMFLGDTASGRSKETTEVVQGILRLPNDSFKSAMLNSALQWALKNTPPPSRQTQIDSAILEEPPALPLQTSDSGTTPSTPSTASITAVITEPTSKCELKNTPPPSRQTQIDSAILEEPPALPLQTSDSGTTPSTPSTASITAVITEPTSKCELKNTPPPSRQTQIDSAILEEPPALPLQTSDSGTTPSTPSTASITAVITEPTSKYEHESSSQEKTEQTLSKPEEVKHSPEQRLLTPEESSQQQAPSGSSGESKDDISEALSDFGKFLKHVIPQPKASDQTISSADTTDSSIQQQEAPGMAENLSRQVPPTFQTKTPVSVSRKLFKDSSPHKSNEQRDVVQTPSSQEAARPEQRVIEYGYLWKRQAVVPATCDSSRNDPMTSPITPGECALEPQPGTSSMSDPQPSQPVTTSSIHEGASPITPGECTLEPQPGPSSMSSPQPSQPVTSSSIYKGGAEPTSSHKSEPPTPRKDESGPSSSRATSAPNSSKKQYTKQYNRGGQREQGECFYQDNYYYRPEAEAYYEREWHHQGWSPSYPQNQGFRWNQNQGYRGYYPREGERRFGRGRRRGGRREPRGPRDNWGGPRQSWGGPRGQWGGS